MKQRILIVDNMPAFIVPIKEVLERSGYEVWSATNLAEALDIATRTKPDVAIVDLRLVDDHSDLDMSGLDLARMFDPQLPKIVLTAYPSVKAVREALGRSSDGLPLATAFLEKKEPLEMLLRAVRLALTPPNPELLRYLGAPAMHALPDRIATLGPNAAAARLGEFISAQNTQFSQQMNLQTKEATEHHRISLLFSALGFLVLLVAIGFSLAGKLTLGVVSTAGSMIIHFLSAIFNRRADQTHQRVEASLRETKELITLGSLLDLCACFSDPRQQDQNRQAIFDAFLGRLVEGGTKKKGKGAGEQS